MRDVAAPFGPHSEAQWRFLAENWLRRSADGRWHPHYDPRIGEAFRATVPEKDMELWPTYDAVRCPTLVMACADGEEAASPAVAESAVANARTIAPRPDNSIIMPPKYGAGIGAENVEPAYRRE